MLTEQRINELAQGIDYHLRNLQPFVKGLEEVKTTLKELQNDREKAPLIWEIQKLREELTMIRSYLEKYGLPEVSQYEREYRSIKESLENWPAAIDVTKICTSEDMKIERASSILDLVVSEDLKGVRFLDFGTGEGHVVLQAQLRQPALAIGYEPTHPENGPLIYNKLSEVAKQGPFDVILLHDVLDHSTRCHPIEVLKQIKEIATSDARVYVRCHPWCSRHGSHIYEQINKAFIHLVFDEIELTKLGGYCSESCVKVFRPLEEYRSWFFEAGFFILSEVSITKGVEEFFRGMSHTKDRLIKHWSGDEMTMMASMEVEFLEYCISPRNNPAHVF